jgi:hypothetical protein
LIEGAVVGVLQVVAEGRDPIRREGHTVQEETDGLVGDDRVVSWGRAGPLHASTIYGHERNLGALFAKVNKIAEAEMAPDGGIERAQLEEPGACGALGCPALGRLMLPMVELVGRSLYKSNREAALTGPLVSI